MGALILHLIFWVVNHGPIDRPRRVNATVARAEEALGRNDYASVSRELRYLVDSLRVAEPAARLDLAHSLYQAKDTLQARQQYQRLDSVSNAAVSSVALHQLGVLTGNRQQTEQALAYFKQALRKEPGNEEARFNFELLKKRLREENEKPNDPDQEASDYAKRLKAQAEQLVQQKRYPEAHRLMAEGLKRDKTVSVFNEFIKRIRTVSQINEPAAPTHR